VAAAERMKFGGTSSVIVVIGDVGAGVAAAS